MDGWIEGRSSEEVMWRVCKKRQTAHACTVIGTRGDASCYVGDCVAGGGGAVYVRRWCCAQHERQEVGRWEHEKCE